MRLWFDKPAEGLTIHPIVITDLIRNPLPLSNSIIPYSRLFAFARKNSPRPDGSVRPESL